jgi:putative transposase
MFIAGQSHHVIQRGNNRSVLFASQSDSVFILECLRNAAAKHGVAVHAYALMKTHIHLLVTPATPMSLPKMMQSVGVRFAQYINRQRPRTGALFEGRYRASLIDSERYFLTCTRYIESNAPRAGVVQRPEDYPWSSYRANALGIRDDLITPHRIYLELGRVQANRELNYRRLFEEPLPTAEIESIRDSTNGAWVLGSETFRTWVEATTGRRAGRRHRRVGARKEHPKAVKSGGEPVENGV